MSIIYCDRILIRKNFILKMIRKGISELLHLCKAQRNTLRFRKTAHALLALLL